jgi:hypothetical protein
LSSIKVLLPSHERVIHHQSMMAWHGDGDNGDNGDSSVTARRRLQQQQQQWHTRLDYFNYSTVNSLHASLSTLLATLMEEECMSIANQQWHAMALCQRFH